MMTDFLENKIVDAAFRGQALTFPSQYYVALFTTTPTDAGGGVEVTGGSYARVSVPCNLTSFAGTQGAGTTVASTGTSGTTSNNVTIAYPDPTAPWGTVVAVGLFGTPTGTDMWFWFPLTSPASPTSGNTVNFQPGDLLLQVDN